MKKLCTVSIWEFPGMRCRVFYFTYAIGDRKFCRILHGKKIVNPILGSKKCPEPESNQRHEDFQSSALPTELSGHLDFLLETFVNIT